MYIDRFTDNKKSVGASENCCKTISIGALKPKD